jgi:DNA invertase Pin-like site-specific DNA recombinase
VPDEVDEWAALDEVLGVESIDLPENSLGPLAFYGRCSTEDNQDPETSLGWQLGNARKFVEPLGGVVVAEYFDVGQSRSVPWDRRDDARRLLSDLKDPNRGWDGVVVGEGTRCWFGNQFSLVAPRFANHGVQLWIPELGSRFDSKNPSHKMLMSVLGGMSESERQHIQARVRAAMDAQVLNEGRHQGGRAPFGYMVVDGGCHPNPRKSAEGYRLRCPSARRPDQNRHRLADGWQGSTVGAILQNPKYTGYAVFGRWTKAEILMDPDNVSAGHVVRFRRASSERIVRSRRPAHPAIVSVAQFTEVQLLRRSRAAGGLDSRRKLERGAKATKWPYALKGMVRCALCGRRMEGTPRRSKNESRTYYRCAARSIAPGSAVLSSHPKNVYLAERAVIGPLNAWIGRLFDREHRNETIRRLAEAGSEASGVDDSRLRQAKKKLADLKRACAGYSCRSRLVWNRQLLRMR